MSSKMKFTFNMSLSESEVQFTANSYEEARAKATEIFWDNVGINLVHNSIEGNKNLDLQL